MLNRSSVRLVTLVGPPGVGKTRLAMAIAHRMGQITVNSNIDEICLVPFAPILDTQNVISTIAQGIGIQEPQADLLVGLKTRLHGQQTLLILDNFEHLVDAAVVINDLLITAPQLKAIVTSRIPLNLSYEDTFHVQPLPIAAAMELFKARDSHTNRCRSACKRRKYSINP